MKPSKEMQKKIIEFFPEYGIRFENIPQKDQIDVGHLLSNTSGFWWAEWSNPFGSSQNDAYAMGRSEEWSDKVVSTPMIREPGEVFNYNSGNSVLLAPASSPCQISG